MLRAIFEDFFLLAKTLLVVAGQSDETATGYGQREENLDGRAFPHLENS